jgi:hypothetical protein
MYAQGLIESEASRVEDEAYLAAFQRRIDA